jgi:arginine decarboxylase
MGAAIEQSSAFHLQGDRIDPIVLKQREDLLGTTSASSLVYGSLDGWRRQMVEQGEELLGRTLRLAHDAREGINGLDGVTVMGREAVDEGYAYDADPLVLSVDVRELGITGYQASELLRSRHHVDLGAADTFRVNARLTHADDEQSVELLVATLDKLRADAATVESAAKVELPAPGDLELESVMRPRDAFFAEVEQVPAAEAVGRIAAEMVTPYPPGVPAIAPGERITAEVVAYLQSGVAAGMLIPEAADPKVESLRVVRSGAGSGPTSGS